MLLNQVHTEPLAEASPWEGLPAAQQPEWGDHPAFPSAMKTLADAPPLVSLAEVRALRRALAAVANGQARLLQIGDCAESLYECTPAHVADKVRVMDWLADRLAVRTGQPVVRVGRVAGQFAKPRSQPFERQGIVELPSFRGHLVNSEVFSQAARRHDPRRMLWGYAASARVLRWLRAERHRRGADLLPLPSGPWASHEALVLDYEGSLVRRDPDTGTPFLGSTHLPWIGERTRQADGAHVNLLATVENPVGCKVGPTASVEEVLRICALLDPERIPGRLVLIPRMGDGLVAEALAPIVAAVRRAGHPVVWLSDPMHGNTIRTPTGVKTRRLEMLVAEATAFSEILERQGQHPGGLHLEVAAEEVTECLGGPVRDESAVQACYHTLCDPRLNPEQAMALVEAWA